MSFLNVSKLTGIPNRLGEYNMEMTFDEALEVLIKKGVISSPDYWVMCAKTTLYIKELIINMAKALGESKMEKISTGTIVRTVLLVLALVNQVLCCLFVTVSEG